MSEMTVTLKQIDSILIFCLLDTQQSYNIVVKSFRALNDAGIYTRQDIQGFTEEKIGNILKDSGCRFPNQRARNLKAFGDNPIDLRSATRDELVNNVKGIGMKLASMFLNWSRDTQYAILDSHILSWMEEEGLRSSNSYEELESIFIKEANKRGLLPSQFDSMLWEQRRR